MSVSDALNRAFGPKRSIVVSHTYKPSGSSGGISGGGLAGSNVGNSNAILNRLMESENQANQAAEQRYQQLLQGAARTQRQVMGTYAQANNLLGTQGNAAKSAAQAAGVQQQGAAAQSLMSRGLGNTTVVDSTRRGINADTQRQIAAIDEAVAGQKAGLLTQQAGAQMNLGQFQADSLLSRRDERPDMNVYLNLLQRLNSYAV